MRCFVIFFVFIELLWRVGEDLFQCRIKGEEISRIHLSTTLKFINDHLRGDSWVYMSKNLKFKIDTSQSSVDYI